MRRVGAGLGYEPPPARRAGYATIEPDERYRRERPEGIGASAVPHEMHR
ncbi:MAG: hypothetical protein OXE05_03595 [Chloroflexi bacterium]|nr:hypothetical protein [Chloroflexota bacterium]